jgi:hypothetical protein
MDDDLFRNIDGSIDPLVVGFFIVFALIALFILLTFVTIIFKGLSHWSRNNNSPLLTVPAVLVGKRQEHSRSSDSSSTWYYVTFEVPGHSNRLELPVHGHQWGTLVEGDRGQLTYQGTRFRSFDRLPQDR